MVLNGPAANPDRRSVIGGAGLASLSALGLGLAGCAVKTDADLVVAINQMPNLLDLSKDANAGTNRPVVENFTESLVGRDLDGNIMPGLATWTLSPDAKAVEFQLRRGVKFHSGHDFTSDDVVFSHERMAKYSTTYQGRIRAFKRLQILDDHTIRFEFARPCFSFLRLRALSIFSRSYFEAVGDQRFGDNPVGTGAYRLAEFKPFEYADLEAFDQYWGGAPQIKKVRVAFVQEDMTRVAMLRSGEADMIMAAPFPMAPQLQASGFRSVQADMHPTFSVRFQLANQNTPWADRRVRLAIAHGIDCAAIIKGLFGGKPKHYASFAPGEFGYDPAISNYNYDPAASRRLLSQAGYAQGFSMPLTYWSNSYYGMRETAEAVALYLRPLGIRCEIQGIDSTQGLEMNRALAKDPNARAVTLAPALLASYSDPLEAMRQGYSGESPYSWYHDKVFDRLLAKALAAPNEAVQSEYLRRCALKIHDDMPIVPLWNNVVVYMLKPKFDYRPTARDIPTLLLKHVTRSA